MEYIMKSGILYQLKDGKRTEPLACIKNHFHGAVREILSPDGTELCRTDIRRAEQPQEGMTGQKYILYGNNGSELMTAQPCCAEGEDSEMAGWPVCRAPRVNCANVLRGDESYRLVMQNSQNYLMTDPHGQTVLQVVHMGITGGWKITAQKELDPCCICSLFIFCRYLEQENEFITI